MGISGRRDRVDTEIRYNYKNGCKFTEFSEFSTHLCRYSWIFFRVSCMCLKIVTGGDFTGLVTKRPKIDKISVRKGVHSRENHRGYTS